MKIITPEFLKTKNFNDSLREIAAIKKIKKHNSKHIIKLLNLSYDAKLNFTLHLPRLNVLKDLTLEEINTLLDHILEALAILELCHIEHRDVRPDNIMYDPGTQRYILIDFDCARLHPAERIRYAPSTAPPECRTKVSILPSIEESYDGKADICALGLTAVILHTKNYLRIKNSFYFFKKEWVKGLPEPLVQRLTPMLEYDPKDRKSARELLGKSRVCHKTSLNQIEITTCKKFNDFVDSTIFEKHVLTLTEIILKDQHFGNDEEFSYYLGALEIANILAGNNNFKEDYFNDLHDSINLKIELLNMLNQKLINRKLILLSIIKTTPNILANSHHEIDPNFLNIGDLIAST